MNPSHVQHTHAHTQSASVWWCLATGLTQKKKKKHREGDTHIDKLNTNTYSCSGTSPLPAWGRWHCAGRGLRLGSSSATPPSPGCLTGTRSRPNPNPASPSRNALSCCPVPHLRVRRQIKYWRVGGPSSAVWHLAQRELDADWSQLKDTRLSCASRLEEGGERAWLCGNKNRISSQVLLSGVCFHFLYWA